MVSFFDGRGEKGIKAWWNELPVTLQTTACVEFLRHHESPGIPRLRYLLLPPTNLGRDVDICGVAEDGTQILGQVPFRQNRDREGFEARKKAERLRKYEDSGAKLVCFVPSVEGNDEDSEREQKLFEDRSPIVSNGVLFISVGEVLEWIEKQPDYAESLFSV